EAFESSLQGTRERCDVALAMRIRGLRSDQRLRRSIASFVLGKLLKAPARANGINVPLGEDGAEPGLQRAAPVEIPEERTLRALAASQTVQLREKGIREVTGIRGTRFATQNGGRSRAQVSTVGGEKMFPGSFTSFGTGAGQGQIFEMQRAEVFFELGRGKRYA